MIPVRVLFSTRIITIIIAERTQTLLVEAEYFSSRGVNLMENCCIRCSYHITSVQPNLPISCISIGVGVEERGTHYQHSGENCVIGHSMEVCFTHHGGTLGKKSEPRTDEKSGTWLPHYDVKLDNAISLMHQSQQKSTK